MSMDIDSECSKVVVGSADNRLVQVAISVTPVSIFVSINYADCIILNCESNLLKKFYMYLF